MLDKALEIFYDRVREARDDAVYQLKSGGATDYAMYRQLVGQIQALETVGIIMKESLQEARKQNEKGEDSE